MLAYTSITTIFKTITCHTIMANMDKIAIMVILAWLHMAMNMADIGGFSKDRENKLELSCAKLSTA